MLLTAKGKVGYGLASVGLSAMELMLQVYLLDLYVLAGLAPSMAGLAIAIAVLWDAVSDPLVGFISDRTPSRTVFGKRAPYMLLGGLLVGLSFEILFSPPSDLGETKLFFYLLLGFTLVNTSMTLFGVPYLSLVNDLADGERERASLFSWKMIFGAIGLLIGIGLPSYLASQSTEFDLESTLELRSSTGVVLAYIAVFSCLATFASCWFILKSRKVGTNEGKASIKRIWAALWIGVRKPLFLYLVAGFILIAVSRSLNASLAMPFYRSTLDFSETEIGLVLLVLTLLIIVSAPTWVWLSKFKSKQALFTAAAVFLGILSAIIYPMLSPRSFLPVYFISVLGGVLVASIVLLDSILSDFIEGEKSNNGVEVAGSYYGIWRMLSKVARAIGIGFAGLFLSWVGYEPATKVQTEMVERSIAWAFGPGVALFLFPGSWLIWRSGFYR